jgi:hypothetical protein
LRTLKDLKWLLAEGKPSPALKAATLLYLHGVRISGSLRLRVGDVRLVTSPAEVVVGGSRLVLLTGELSNLLRGLSMGKSGEDLILGYNSVPEFHAEFRRMVRTSKLVRFDLSDIKEMFRAAAGSDYALLKQYESARPFTPDDVSRAWLKVLPRLVVGVETKHRGIFNTQQD